MPLRGRDMSSQSSRPAASSLSAALGPLEERGPMQLHRSHLSKAKPVCFEEPPILQGGQQRKEMVVANSVFMSSTHI